LRDPRVFTIPPGIPFLPTLAEALAGGVLTEGWPDGAALADATIYLPTRRAGRAFAALLADRAGGRAALMPRIVPLGEAEGDAVEAGASSIARPPIAPLERRLILTRLVQAWAAQADRQADLNLAPGVPFSVPGSPADAVALAGNLEALMDSLAVEGVPWDALEEVVEVEYSRYFALTLKFVRIAHEEWPRILAERGASDPARDRHEALLAEARRLAASPPHGPVIAAGSTGSMPATAALLAAISRLPHGAVVLPGLDTHLDDAAWTALGGGQKTGADEPIWGHPQYRLRRLLTDHLGIGRDSVRVLGPSRDPNHPSDARRRLVSEVMRPAETTDEWAAIPPLEHLILVGAGTEGLALIQAADEREEALAVAIALRETLAEPGRVAALVTPDRSLARRVSAELGRWGVVASDSAGVPLSDAPAGRLARLSADAAALDFHPVQVLALLAHPAVTLGLHRDDVERAASALEIAALRGPIPAAGIAGLAAALELRRSERGRRDPLPRQNLADRGWDAAADLLQRLADAFSAFAANRAADEVDLTALAALHAETVAALTEPAADAEEPELAGSTALLAFFDELALTAGTDAPGRAVTGRFRDYPAFFTALARERALPPQAQAGHRRVKILGLLEARLLHVDRVVLGGLDETVWPPSPETDAFLNRPMRLKLGLSPAERRIGQTAHDFAQALGTADVILARARKRDGKPTVPSRFLERLRAFSGDAAWTAMTARGERYRSLAAAIDRPRPTAPLRRPAPRPGAARFPRSLSVTEIETLVRDPYAIYARHILRLTPLDPIAAPPSLAERGSILHGILAEFGAAYPGALPDTAEADLLQRGLDAFGRIEAAYPELYALWLPDFERLVPHYLAWEERRRQGFGAIQVERYGKIEIALGEGAPLVVRGYADRIELAGRGGAAIIDFKTGTPPTNKVVAAGFSPQLTLEAAMLRAGGFEGVAAQVSLPDLHYVKLGGRKRLTVQEVQPPPKDGRALADIVEAHVTGLAVLARRYALEGAGYLSRPYAQYANRYSAYDHLARVKEWSATAGPEGEGA